MSETNFPMIADLHCHPTIAALNTKYDMWHYDPPTDGERSNMISTSKLFGDFTQSDYTSLSKTKARLVFHGIYPVEQGILMPDYTIRTYDKWLTDVVKLAVDGFALLFGRHRLSRFFSKVIYQMIPARYDEITSLEHSYFDDLTKEYNIYISQQAKYPTLDALTVIEKYADLKAMLGIGDNYEINVNPNEQAIRTGVVFSIEGAHALGCGQRNSLLDNDPDIELAMLNDLTNPKTIELKDKLVANINALKQFGPPGKPGAHAPFYVTFCHHFWNQLCGQAMSLAGVMNKIANQRRGLGRGFTELGKIVLAELLSKRNGKRILIDVKHMSPAGRNWYYGYLADFKAQTNEVIPIIASHMGVTGNSVTIPNTTDPQEMDDKYNGSTSYFNIWDINLSGDDILAIHASGGLIGLNFDQRILSGAKTIDNLTAITNGFKQTITIINDDGDEVEVQVPLHTILAYRAVWAQPIVEALLFIVKTIYDKQPDNAAYAWQMVCIGSDFDGFINAIDAYCHAEDFQVLAFVLLEHLKNRAQVDPILQNQDLNEIVKGFMYKNALRFLDKHFN